MAADFCRATAHFESAGMSEKSFRDDALDGLDFFYLSILSYNSEYVRAVFLIEYSPARDLPPYTQLLYSSESVNNKSMVLASAT